MKPWTKGRLLGHRRRPELEAVGDLIPDDHDVATRVIGEYIDGYYNSK